MPAARNEKRGRERIELLGELRGEVTVFQPVVIKEIGIAGAEVETSTPLQLNSLHDFRFGLGSRSVVLKGRVVHARISEVDQDVVRYRSGVEFVETSARVLAAIRDFIATIKASRTNVRHDT